MTTLFLIPGKNPRIVWSYKHQFCVECKRIKFRHKGRGLCSSCWDKARAKTEKRKKTKLKSSRKYHEREKLRRLEDENFRKNFNKKAREYSRKKYAEDPEYRKRCKESNRKSYLKNKEKRLEEARKYNEAHPEVKQKAIKRWLEKNREKVNQKNALIREFRRLETHGIITIKGIKFKTPFPDFIKIGREGYKYTMKDVETWKEICLNSYKKGFNTYLINEK